MDIRAGDIKEALGLLTRLPVRLRGAPRGAAAAWAYPIAGLAVGGVGGLVAWIGAGLAPGITAGLALAAMIVVTGALHEDGLADTADGLWGGWTRERRLEIMKDSRIGAYGVLALVLATGLRWAALAEIGTAANLPLAILVAAIVSRAPMVAVMHVLPNARADGLSSATGRPNGGPACVACVIAVAFGSLFIGVSMLWVALLLLLSTALVIVVASRKIGGQTGDILGATQQVSEIVTLVAISAIWLG